MKKNLPIVAFILLCLYLSDRYFLNGDYLRGAKLVTRQLALSFGVGR